MNLDRILPPLSPLIRRTLASKQSLRRMQFASVPQASGRVVFLGDSITEWTAWEDWFPEVATTNRGIGGEAICDVQARLDTAVVDPAAISLMIGTNDLHGLGLSREIHLIAGQMLTLVQDVRRRAPSADLLVNSVLPRSSHFRDRIMKLNDHYRQIAKDCDASYIDLWPALASSNGAIRSEMTTDGLHLSVAGYRAWTDELRPYLARFVA